MFKRWRLWLGTLIEIILMFFVSILNKNKMDYQKAILIIQNSKELTDFEKMLFITLITTGVRISELLGINVSQISKEGLATIKGAKGSRSRLIQMANWDKVKHEVAGADYLIGDVYSRFYVYRKFKKLGITSQKIDFANLKVTHMGRNMFVQNMRENGLSESQISEIIGHKSLESIKFYG